MIRRAAFLFLLLALAELAVACKSRAPSPSEPPKLAPTKPIDRWTDDELLAEGARFLDEPAYRRKALEASLVNPTNTYSRQRLDAYGLGDRGWDLLPEWNPRSAPVGFGKAPALDPKTAPLWDRKRPSSRAAWVTLGREVFFGYPLRSEVFMAHALERPALAARVGLRADKNGIVPGARVFVDIDGSSKVGITCAVCHTSVDDRGDVVVGAAHRAFDYGALRLAYHADTKSRVDPDLARRMETWGPGRADVTEDDDEDPVAIPDLWGLIHQSHLTQAGTIRQASPLALVIRQETQLLHSNHQRVRPPRELAFALAMFLYSLEPPAHGGTRDPRGEELFTKQCRSCHANDAFGGVPIVHRKIGTDGALATGHARGTGNYRPPALLAAATAGPYFHHGAVPTLADVLDPARLEPDYTRSPLGKGPVPGHTFGTDLPPADRHALVAYLESL